MRITPAHIIAAAKAAAAQAPDFTPDILAGAYRAIGVKDETGQLHKIAACFQPLDRHRHFPTIRWHEQQHPHLDNRGGHVLTSHNAPSHCYRFSYW